MLENALLALDRRWWAVQSVVLLLVLAALWGLFAVEVEDSPERWIPKSTMEAWAVFDQHFDVGDSVAVGLEFHRPVRDQDVHRLRKLRQELMQIPGMKQIYDPSVVAEEIEGVPLTELIDPANVERFHIYAGSLWDIIGDPQHRTLVLIGEMRYLPPDQADQLNQRRRETVRQVYQAVQSRQTDPDWEGIKLHVASGIVIMYELEKRARYVAMTFLPMAVLLGLGSLLYGFRSPQALLVALLAATVACVLVLGWFTLMGGAMGAVTMTAPTLISIIAIATTVHFTSHVADHQGSPDQYRPGGRHREALIRWVAVPCLGAATTTGLGFLMLGFNELEPIRMLGFQLFIGAILAFFGVLLVTQWLPITTAQQGSWFAPSRMSDLLSWQLQRPGWIIGGMTLLCLGCLYLAWPRPADAPVGLHVDADPFSFFSDDEPVSRSLAHFSQKKFGMYQLEVVLVPKEKGVPPRTQGTEDQVYRQNQAAAAAFNRELLSSEGRQAGVARVVSTQVFQQRQQQFQSELFQKVAQGGVAEWMSVGERLYSLLRNAHRFREVFRSWSDDRLDEGAMRVTVLAVDQGPQGFRPLVDYVRGKLPEDRFKCYVTGTIAQIVRLSDGLVIGLYYGLGLSLLVMAALCLVLFRSWRLAAAAFLPNAFPLLMVFGLMGALKIPISSGTAMVATVALGIALNDTVHFLLHYRKLTRECGESVSIALDETVRHIGRPIVLTSLVHVVGFAIFLLTDFVPLFHFGVLAGVAMLAAIVGDLVLLPCLLKVIDQPPTSQPGQGALVQTTQPSPGSYTAAAG